MVSEVCTPGRSIPSTCGSTGREPVAITMLSAVMLWPLAVFSSLRETNRTCSV